MFYITKWIDLGADTNGSPTIWPFLYSKGKHTWILMKPFAEAYNTRKEAEDTLIELGLTEDTTKSEEDGKVNIVWLNQNDPSTIK
jgi:hypothetical protein